MNYLCTVWEVLSAKLLSLRVSGAGLELSGNPVVFEKVTGAEHKRNAAAISLLRGNDSRLDPNEHGFASRGEIDEVAKKSAKLSTSVWPTNIRFSLIKIFLLPP